MISGEVDFGEILAPLGPHRLATCCLYLGRLGKVDEGALRALIRAGPADQGRRQQAVPA